MTEDFTANLPAVATARLPASYEAAQVALAACQKVDECKDWADRAGALASYARQSQDDALMKMAVRIKARAIRRAGELLAQIEAGQGARDAKTGGMGDHLPLRSDVRSRRRVFTLISRTQAVRIAAVPEDSFEAQVEGPTPPTLTALARQGTTPRHLIDLKGRDPGEYNRALHFVAAFSDYAREVEEADVEGALPILVEKERARLRDAIARIDAIHDRIMTRV